MNIFVVAICQCYQPNSISDSRYEEINVIDERQGENRPVLVQEAEIRWKKVSLFVVLSGRSKGNSRSPLTVPVR